MPLLDVPEVEYEKLRSRVKQALVDNLAPDETIHVIIRGTQGQAIVGTDRRAFVCKPGFMAGATFGAAVTNWAYRHIIGVQVHKGMVNGAIAIQAAGQGASDTSYWGNKKDDAYKAPNAIPVAGDWNVINAPVARLRQLVDASQDSSPPPERPIYPPAPERPDAIGQIRQLGELRDAGIVTQEEFDAKKADLLARL